VQDIAVSSASLSAQIRSKNATVAVVGLGVAGLEQAMLFARSGFSVIGIESDRVRASALKQTHNGVRPATSKDPALAEVTSDYDSLADADCIVLCMPTSYHEDGSPALEALSCAGRDVAARLHAGQLVVLESTVPPGTTRGVLLPLLESSGLTAGRDFFLAFSPERVDPGSKSHALESIPKLVGGLTDDCGALAADLYGAVAAGVHIVSSPEVAELAKVFENTFRFVNIGLVNELALLCGALDLDVQEVITASSTKPFAFMAHRPGPGVGGRCIPMAPQYLSWVAREAGQELAVTRAAIELNDAMPGRVAARVQALLAERGIRGRADVLLVGMAYKPNVDDTRGSVALKVAEELIRGGLNVVYHDPHVPSLSIGGEELRSQPLVSVLLERVACAVVLCPHDDIDYDQVFQSANLIVDPTGRLAADGERVFSL
jgi:UDP-N-acetyl-D-glucosamine dehydrogenase